ncbi:MULTISPECIES: multidrug effflux MFS transporter [Phenylobacterium]|uniref:Bcr/CflA family efflux transporter n=1 Tax=Phenylobacterium koreense TaxID=266125 RepID=A0ABV2EDH8_9CAUL
MKTGFARLALVLGLITAAGPFAIDMYLPALPSIGETLNASASAVQMSLTAFFVTLGVCQLVYGPMADMFGRKPPIYAGLALFIAGSIGCALAPTVETLIAFRVLQAVGACAGMVVPRAIVRDLHTGHEAARLMSLLMLVVSISPILAPLAGSALIAVGGWRSVFWAVTIAGVVGLLLAALQLQETRPAEHRAETSWSGILTGYRTLLADPAFMGLTFAGAFGMSTFFVYLAGSSFVLIGHYGLSPTVYSLFFGLNAVSFFGAAQFNGWLARRFGMAGIIRVASTGLAVTMAALVAVFALGIERLEVMTAFLLVAYAFLGVVTPTTAVLALDHHGKIAGAASALMGSLQMVVGSAVMGLAGLFADGTPGPMIAAMGACAITCFLVAQVSLRSATAAQVPAE